MSKKMMFLIVFCIFMIFPVIALADTGPKPSIDLKINNLDTTNYIVDLFVYDEDGQKYNSEADYNGNGLSDDQIAKLHSLNFDGWISESTRWRSYLLFADCSGNNKYEHKFSYFGTPTRYKVVIINNDTGDIKISKEIVRKDFNSNVVIDYMTMDTNGNSSNNNLLKTIIVGIAVLVSTLVIELAIAYVFKIGNYKTIVFTNMITNLGLQILLILLVKNYLLTFIVGEAVVFISELIIYLFKFKDVSKSKTILYTLISNMVTLICTFLLYKI